jgi:queuine tRNA-ribosyltransferase
MTSALLQMTHGPLELPAFLPDATRGSVRCLDAADLVACGIPGLVVNSLHLSSHPGTSLIERLGGIHRFMGWDRPIVSDSGGFQVLSLAREAAELVTVANKGIYYRKQKKDDKRLLTPEKCIAHQFELGSDLMYCLDYCTHPDDPEETQRSSVSYTITWARRCREEFDRRVDKLLSHDRRPLLFAVVQGGLSRDLRQESAGRLQEIGFDGYGFGGWPIDGEGGLVEMVELVARVVPAGSPIHALGIGKPEHVVSARRMGYSLFDCVLPTRDARHGRLYVFHAGWETRLRRDPRFYEFVYIKDIKYKIDGDPIDPTCDCLACRRYSRSYVNHLFHVEEASAHRLATIHNLRFYSRLIARLRSEDRFDG